MTKMRSSWAWTASVLLAIAAGSYGLYVWLQPAPLPDQLLYGNGHIEGIEVRVAAEVGGRVIESRLVEGTPIKRGDLLVRLDDTELELQKAHAEAEVQSLRRQRDASAAELQLWRHHRMTAASDLSRSRALETKGVATPQQLDQAANTAEAAAGNVAALEALTGSFDAQVTAAQRQADVVSFKIGKSRVVAPIDGTILAKVAEVGDFVQPGGTVAVLLDLSRIELKIYLPESEIGKVKLDAAARVRVDAFPNRYFEARVEHVDPEAQFTPRDIHMPQERTRTVFGVTLAIDNRDGVLKPGMPVDAWILWRPQAGWPTSLFVPQG